MRTGDNAMDRDCDILCVLSPEIAATTMPTMVRSDRSAQRQRRLLVGGQRADNDV